MTRITLQPAYVLHTQAYRNSSLLVEIFSRDHGRIGLIARGARAKGFGQLQPFRPLSLSWSGQGELKTLTNCEETAPAKLLQGMALACGFYLNELLLRLLHREDPHSALFTYYADALYGLHEQSDKEIVLRIFEKYLLAELGYGLVLDYVIDTGEAIRDDRDYIYWPEQGLREIENGGSQANIVSGRCLRAFTAEHFESPFCRQQIKQLMRRVLAFHLGNRPLKSRELVEALMRLSMSANDSSADRNLTE